MKIVNSKTRSVPFENINWGQVFKDEYGIYYMRIRYLCIDDETFVNWVRLSDGEVGFAIDSAMFEVVDCELVVK